MTESKIEITERLRREGRWSEASLFKDTELRKLRSGGVTKADAGDEAWRRMAEKFPPMDNSGDTNGGLFDELPDAAAGEPSPPPSPKGADTDIDVDALLERIGDNRQPADLVRDTLWTYENLENRRARPQDAPSLGAWALLAWARQYRNRFFEQVLPKAMMNRPIEDEENLRKAERRSIEEINGVLQQFNDKMEADLRRDLLADVPRDPSGRPGPAAGVGRTVPAEPWR